MKKLLLFLLLAVNINSQSLAPVQHIFMQSNDINTAFTTDGIMNCDKITFSSWQAGFIWPAGSIQRLTVLYASGLWIGAKVGPQKELRLAASWYRSHYSPGNIPVIGGIPPSSVCNDPSWRAYQVQLTDPSLINGGTRNKTAGGRQYTFNYDSWANWPVAKGAPYVEVNGIPGYQPAWDGDRPGIGNGMTARPEEILFMMYIDYTNCSGNIHASEEGLPGGTLPLGVEVHQLVYSFNCLPLKDMYFVKYEVINKSLMVWDSTYFSSVNESALGNDMGDDVAGCDSARGLGLLYNYDNNDEGGYGLNPPAVGHRLIQSPYIYTGSGNDTVYLPYDTLIGYKKIKVSGFNTFINAAGQCFGVPSDAVNAYNYMRGKDGCGNTMLNWVTGQETTFRYSGNACSRTGWNDSTPQHSFDILNTGPFTMNSGDTQTIVLNYMVTRDGGNNFQNVCAVQSLSDSALKYYYNDFKTCMPIGIEPISSEIPQRYELLQNYPNPFNPMTKLTFRIPLLRGVDGEAGRGVLLKVYDVLGKEIAVLVNQNLKPGTYEIEWDASNIPSGVYFYSLITNEFTQTKKMVVLK